MPSILFAHGDEQHSNEMDKHGIITKKMSVNNYELTFNITSNGISLVIRDEKNKKHIRNAVVKIKLISPDKSEEIQKLEAKGDRYEYSFSMTQEGTYKAFALIKIDGKINKAGFQYKIMGATNAISM